MIRYTLGCTVLAGASIWLLTQPVTAQTQPKPAQPASPGSSGTLNAQPTTNGTMPHQSQKINEFIAKGWADSGVKSPAAKATDHEFLRRTFIDLIGRIATPEEVIDFERDYSPNKRVKLVQRLLNEDKYQPKNKGGQFYPKPGGKKGEFLKFDYTDEYAEHWANLWTVWLMTRTGHPTYREQMRVWLELQFARNISHKDLMTKLLTVSGTPGEDRKERGGHPDVNAANFIIHHLGDPVPAAQRTELGAFEAVPITSRVTKLFLGIQTQCTQCHDHPHNKQWLQSDFWGVNAFFRQTVRSATPTGAPMGNQNMQATAIALSDDASINSEMLIYYERRDGQKRATYPIMLKDLLQAENGQKSSKMIAAPMAGKSRRQQLAEWILAHDNFAKSYVNRIWGHLFGRGMNKDAPVDDFGSHNEVLHPELLAYLAEEFIKYNYDSKQLLEWICCSDVYGLSHVANKEYTATKFDPYFARMPLKAMSPEVLFDSLMTATRGNMQDDEGARLSKQDRQALREAWMRKLVRNFGDDEGNELTFNGTVVQALLMMNGSELNGEIGVGAGRNGRANVNNVVQQLYDRHSNGGRNAVSPAAMYDELFLLTLNRHPTQLEIRSIEEVRSGNARIDLGSTTDPKTGKPKPAGGAVIPGTLQNPKELVAFYQDVFWALLNSREFMLNH